MGIRGSVRCVFFCRRFLGYDKFVGYFGYSLEGERV